MAVTLRNAVTAQLKPTKKSAVKAVVPLVPLTQPGRLRVGNLKALFNCSHTTIYQWIKDGEIPKPDGYDYPGRPIGKQGRPYWFNETILPMVQKQA